MKSWTSGQFTTSFFHDGGVPVGGVIALLAQLKPGSVIHDVGVDVNGPFAGT